MGFTPEQVARCRQRHAMESFNLHNQLAGES